ncbi:TIGR03089 family protein [Arachnia propionica]|uniref:TIGR03089 family protein n=1 Tax=Arachnia propionica TaxID=1750 RepID=A0A3P1WST0_9ACTN|nr:TIGR03089 family protein [Arachnia propionica]RRD49682.1 hypothetical protein EII35_07290 [Arachnia propionica]
MLFADALRALPASHPLLVHYDEEAASRVELSAVTFRNWVDKTANLMDGLGIGPGDEVQVELAATHPGHWATWVVCAAVWQRGAAISSRPGDLAVVASDSATRGPQTVVCSLHPLGLRLPEPPPGTVDLADALGEPDLHLAEPLTGDMPAWDDLDHRQVAEVPPRSSRSVFHDPQGGWEGIAQLLVAPVLGGGGTVSVTGGDATRARHIAAQERGVLV